jgi:hypothetical protein
MQALANQISYYDLRLQEPFQVLSFLRDELAADEGSQAKTDAADQSDTPPGSSGSV